ncbi:MAG: hypothetical protein RLZZ215_2654 [Pseudomonadota bacterium]|jgi:gamma-butyrobetaine dioxygenase
MHIQVVHFSAPSFVVIWDNGAQARFPAIFLRDNDPSDLHAATQERTSDLAQIDLTIAPVNYQASAEQLQIQWPDKSVPSLYSSIWLYQHRLGQRRADAADIPRIYWGSAFIDQLPRFRAADCQTSTQTLYTFLQALKRYGLVIINELADDPKAGFAFGDLIGFKRETNFGRWFEVMSKPDPNNLAYTALALPLHIDLTNQELVPGYQFLHCYRNQAQGGDSIFADAFQVCTDLREQEPAVFATLLNTIIPSRFHDQDYDIRHRHPLIRLNDKGELQEFLLNAHLADIPDMEEDSMLAFYQAYQWLMRRLRDPKYMIQLKLNAGEMVVFDNRRVLHGRTAFNPNTGQRQLLGYYIDRGEVDSRIRKLAESS